MPRVTQERTRRFARAAEQSDDGLESSRLTQLKALPLAAQLAQLSPMARGGGRPLEGPVQRKMEEGFGADFSSLRVHEGVQARSLGARAFTEGESFLFRARRVRAVGRQGHLRTTKVGQI